MPDEKKEIPAARKAPAKETPERRPLRHDLRREEGEETEFGREIRARQTEEGQEPEELGFEETRPL
jgi:hypothetical protein